MRRLSQMLQRPNNPVGRTIYDSFHLIFPLLVLVVLRILYKLLPLPIFLIVLAIPSVYIFYEVTKAPPKADDPNMVAAARSKRAERLSKELEREENERIAKEKKKGNKKKNGSKQQPSSRTNSVSDTVVESFDDDEDDDDMLSRMAQARRDSKTKAR